MRKKSIKISEEAYNALRRRRIGKESLSDIILRLAPQKGSAASLLKLIQNSPADEELAKNIELAMKEPRKARMRNVILKQVQDSDSHSG